MPIGFWKPEQLQQALEQNVDLVLLDVREPHEYAFARIEGSVHIPLRQLPEQYQTLNPESDLVLICHHGVRSLQACQFLEYAGFNKLYNLLGGIDAWSVACDSSVPRY